MVLQEGQISQRLQARLLHVLMHLTDFLACHLTRMPSILLVQTAELASSALSSLIRGSLPGRLELQKHMLHMLLGWLQIQAVFRCSRSEQKQSLCMQVSGGKWLRLSMIAHILDESTEVHTIACTFCPSQRNSIFGLLVFSMPPALSWT